MLRGLKITVDSSQLSRVRGWGGSWPQPDSYTPVLPLAPPHRGAHSPDPTGQGFHYVNTRSRKASWESRDNTPASADLSLCCSWVPDRDYAAFVVDAFSECIGRERPYGLSASAENA